MTETIRTRHRAYDGAQIRKILNIYRALFPREEITPTLRAYWDFDRKRRWSYLTTDFHAATPDRLAALHEASLEIEARWKAGELTVMQKGDALVAASRREGVGFSLGLNPWTDNLLLRTFATNTPMARRRLVVVVGHDWYPVGAGKDPESPLLDQGLHWTTKYHGPCPEAFFATGEEAPAVLFHNLYPDFRAPDQGKTGAVDTDQLTYPACVAGLQEMLRVLAPKFRDVSVISWGGQAWSHMLALVTPVVRKVGVKKFAEANPGRLLKFGGFDYLPISHPSMPNQVIEHLRVGFREMGLGRPMSDVKAGARGRA